MWHNALQLSLNVSMRYKCTILVLIYLDCLVLFAFINFAVGVHLCMNSPVDPALLQVVQQELKSLQDVVDNMCVELNQRKTKIQHELRSIAVTLNYMEKRLQRLEIGQRNLESHVDQTDSRLDKIEGAFKESKYEMK